MDQRIKQLWIDALRSGNYKQGRGRLKSEDEYCCLGVLCDLYRKETGKGCWDNNSFIVNSGRCNTVLPEEVMNWADLDDVSGIYNDGATNALSIDNDKGCTFEKITETIETFF